jgi:hypothetical protein
VEVRRKIGEKVASNNREPAAWDREHRGVIDREAFRVEILPTLARVSASQIAAATGLSRDFSSTIKSGRYVAPPKTLGSPSGVGSTTVAPSHRLRR